MTEGNTRRRLLHLQKPHVERDIVPHQYGVGTEAVQLRQYRTPVFARIQSDQVLIDPRTLLDGDDKIVVEALIEILGCAE